MRFDLLLKLWLLVETDLLSRFLPRQVAKSSLSCREKASQKADFSILVTAGMVFIIFAGKKGVC